MHKDITYQNYIFPVRAGLHDWANMDSGIAIVCASHELWRIEFEYVWTITKLFFLYINVLIPILFNTCYINVVPLTLSKKNASDRQVLSKNSDVADIPTSHLKNEEFGNK